MKFHVILTKEDADIIAFKNFLPKGKFNENVIRILRHALKGEIPDEPMTFEIDVCASKAHTKVDLPEDLVLRCRERFGGRYGFTTAIKAEIRKYIVFNRKETNDQRVEVDHLKSVFQAAEENLADLPIRSDPKCP